MLSKNQNRPSWSSLLDINAVSSDGTACKEWDGDTEVYYRNLKEDPWMYSMMFLKGSSLTRVFSKEEDF